MPAIAAGLRLSASAGGAAILLLAAAPAAAAPDFATSAPIAAMFDLGSGRVLLARQEHRRFPPASMTKIMTAYVAFELIGAGKLHPSQSFTVAPATARKWAGVGTSMNLAPGSRVTVDALLTGLMTASANDGAVVLAEGIAGSVDQFAALMNAEARRLGLKDSRFATPSGWPDQGQTLTSAADLVTLSKAMIEQHPALYRRYIGRSSFVWNGVELRNHLPLIGVPGGDGVKTGYTRESGYGVVGSAERGGRRLLFVLAGYPSAGLRDREARSFLEWGFAAWQTQRLFAAGQKVARAKVQQGAAREVGLLAPNAYFLTFAAGEPRDYKLQVRYRGPLQAPLRRGEHVADLVVSPAGQGARTLPLVAALDVGRAGFWARLRNGLFGLLGA